MNTIMDDLGNEWVYDPQRGDIRIPACDAVVGSDNNGYSCDSFRHGVALLVDDGYISPWSARQQMQSQPAKIKAQYKRCATCGEVERLCECGKTPAIVAPEGAGSVTEGKRTRHVVGCGYPYFACTCAQLEAAP